MHADLRQIIICRTKIPIGASRPNFLLISHKLSPLPGVDYLLQLSHLLSEDWRHSPIVTMEVNRRIGTNWYYRTNYLLSLDKPCVFVRPCQLYCPCPVTIVQISAP